MRRISAVGSTVLFLVLVIVPSAAAQTERKETAEDRVLHFLRRIREYKPAPDADELTRLLIQRFEAASFEVRMTLPSLGEPAILYTPSLSNAVKRMVDAELEVVAKQKDRLAILEGHIEFLKEAQRVTRDCHLRGGTRGVTLKDVARANHDRFDAEIRLLRAKREPDPTKRP